MKRLGTALKLALWLGAVSAAPMIVPSTAFAGTLTIAQGFDAKSLFPYSSTGQEDLNPSSTIVETLFWQDPKTKSLLPLLALGYERVDPKEIHVKLRENVKFSNGEVFDADAVLKSLEIFADVKQAPSYSQFSSHIESFSKIDDHTISIKLNKPYPAIELILSQIYVLPPQYFALAGPEEFGRKPIGTGPYRFEEWVRDDVLRVSANPDYWGTTPSGIDEIVWRPVPEDLTRAAGILTGEYDIANNIPVDALPSIESNPKTDLVSVQSYRVFSLFLPTKKDQPSPLHDVRVRQALNHAIDKDSIIKNLFGGRAAPLNGQLIRSNQLGFNPDLKDYAYDPEKAKALLAEAGFGDGFDIVLKSSVGRYVHDREVAEVIAAQLGQVGVRVQPVVLEAGEFLRQMNAGELNPISLGGFAPVDDPDVLLTVHYQSGTRYSQTESPELDALLERGRLELDVEKRASIYGEAAKLIHDQALSVFLYVPDDIYATSSRVKGFLPRGDQRWTIYGVSIEE